MPILQKALINNTQYQYQYSVTSQYHPIPIPHPIVLLMSDMNLVEGPWIAPLRCVIPKSPGSPDGDEGDTAMNGIQKHIPNEG